MLKEMGLRCGYLRFAILVLLVLPFNLCAQTSATGALTGTVTDSSRCSGDSERHCDHYEREWPGKIGSDGGGWFIQICLVATG